MVRGYSTVALPFYTPCSGTGLSDGYPPGEWDGEDVSWIIICFIELSCRSYVLSQSDEFFARLPYDLLTIGKWVHAVDLRAEHLTDYV